MMPRFSFPCRFAALSISAIAWSTPVLAADLTQQDKLFATETAAGSQSEIELAKLAAKKAQDAEVQQFAQHMIDDHTKMFRELDSVLQKLDVSVPDEPPTNTQHEVERLSQLRGVAFDREYMKLMVESHDKTAASFGDESEAGKQPDLRRFADQHLATIRAHLDRALTLDGKLSVATQTPPTDPMQSQNEANSNRAAIQPDKPISQRTAADLVEQPVITRDGETIGRIKDIVLDQTNGKVFAIIPVGGVFSIGDKDIAVDAKMLRNNPGSDPRGSVLVDATEDDLKAMPAFAPADRYVQYPDDRALGEMGRF